MHSSFCGNKVVYVHVQYLKKTYTCNKNNRNAVLQRKCSICERFRDRLMGRRNYSAAYIEGSVNLRVSSYKEHAASEMHARAMLLLKKQVCTYILL